MDIQEFEPFSVAIWVGVSHEFWNELDVGTRLVEVLKGAPSDCPLGQIEPDDQRLTDDLFPRVIDVERSPVKGRTIRLLVVVLVGQDPRDLIVRIDQVLGKHGLEVIR